MLCSLYLVCLFFDMCKHTHNFFDTLFLKLWLPLYHLPRFRRPVAWLCTVDIAQCSTFLFRLPPSPQPPHTLPKSFLHSDAGVIIPPPSSLVLSLAVLRAHKVASLRATQGALTTNLEVLKVALGEFASHENCGSWLKGACNGWK